MDILTFNFFSIMIYGVLFLNKYTKDKWKNIFLILTTIQLIVLNGFRDLSIGVDTYRYARHFYRIRELSSLTELVEYDMEFGFVLLSKFISFFFNHQIMFLAAAALIYIPLAFFINKYSNNIFLSYYLYITIGFFEGTFNTLRQSVAISLTLIAFHFAMQRKPHAFLLMTFAAASFHISALIILPIYFLTHFRLNTRNITLIGLIYTFLLLFRYEIGRIFTVLYYGDRAGPFLERYSPSPGIGGTAIALIGLFVLYTFMHTPTKNREDKLLNVTYNINIVAIFIQTLSSFSYMFTRLNFYFLIYLIIYIPMLLGKTERSLLKDYDPILKSIKPVMYVMIILFLGFFYLDGVMNNINELLPYKAGWEYYFSNF